MFKQKFRLIYMCMKLKIAEMLFNIYLVNELCVKYVDDNITEISWKMWWWRPILCKIKTRVSQKFRKF